MATQILVVSAAAAISDVGLNAADRRLDSEHYPCVHPMAFAHTWASMGGALPGWVMLLEYGCVAIAAAIIALRRSPQLATPRCSME